MVRANPIKDRLQRRVLVEPVPSLLIRRLESIGDSLIGNSGEFLDHQVPLVNGTHTRAKQDQPHISEGRVSLTQHLQIAVLRLASLKDGLAPLHPFHGGCSPQEDSLGLETPGAGVEDYASCPS